MTKIIHHSDMEELVQLLVGCKITKALCPENDMLRLDLAPNPKNIKAIVIGIADSMLVVAVAR
jgi:hypothetical protein